MLPLPLLHSGSYEHVYILLAMSIHTVNQQIGFVAGMLQRASGWPAPD